MIITTTDFIPSKNIIEILGVVQGSTVRVKHIGHELLTALKSIIGGELCSYTRLITESREQAIQRMIEDANQMGADAIINVRFVTAEITTGAAEILVYGTAVKIA